MSGPGTELKKIFEGFGVRDDGKCKCKQHVALMDKWGPQGCENNRETILIWLKKSCQDRNIPFNKAIANAAISLAIRRSKRVR